MLIFDWVLIAILAITPAGVVYHEVQEEMEAEVFILQEQLNFQEWNNSGERCELRWRHRQGKLEECELRAFAKWCSVTRLEVTACSRRD